MPLRIPNAPVLDTTILNILRLLLPGYDPINGPAPNTQLAAMASDGTGQNRIFIQNRFAMTLGPTPFPAVHLEAGPQTYHFNSQRTLQGQVSIDIEYYDRWDEQANTIDVIRAGIAADLECMRANLESNPSLNVGGQAYANRIVQISLSPYQGSLNDTLIPGVTLVERTLTITVLLLPYDAQG